VPLLLRPAQAPTTVEGVPLRPAPGDLETQTANLLRPAIEETLNARVPGTSPRFRNSPQQFVLPCLFDDQELLCLTARLNILLTFHLWNLCHPDGNVAFGCLSQGIACVCAFPVSMDAFYCRVARRLEGLSPLMKGTYCGHLSRLDPLFGFLVYDILPRIDVYVPHPEFRVFELVASNSVYAYEEAHSRACVVGKFFGPTFGWDHYRAVERAEREYRNLETLRGYGLVGCPHHVIRPLALNRDLGCLLVQEHYRGEPLSQAIQGAIHQGSHAHLFWRLKALGYFLATQHNRTANGQGVDFEEDCRYLDHLLGQLQAQRRIDGQDADEFRWLRDRWREQPAMWQDQQVWLHGDATPANFLFGGGLDVAAIDLERMKRGDRVFDVGRIAGELCQAFLNATGDSARAEPFIGHFLWEYACHFPDRQRAFRSITQRVPYYMGLTLLRIARNDWVSVSYCRTLIERAKPLLRSYWKKHAY